MLTQSVNNTKRWNNSEFNYFHISFMFFSGDKWKQGLLWMTVKSTKIQNTPTKINSRNRYIIKIYVKVLLLMQRLFCV